MLFFSSDFHIGHEAIIKHSERPFETVEEMEEEIVSRWNSLVTKQDWGVLVGDTFWEMNQAKDTERAAAFIKRLNGTIMLIEGNHDYRCVRRLEPVRRQIASLTHGEYSFAACHYPMLSWNRSHHGRICVHGHTHQKTKISEHPTGKALIHIGVDAWDFYPVSAEEVVACAEVAKKLPDIKA